MKSFKWKGRFSVLALLLMISVLLYVGYESFEEKKGKTDSARSTDVNPHQEAIKVQISDVFGVKVKDLDAGGTLKGQYKGQKIVVGTKQGELEAGLKAVAPIFEQVSGSKVEINAYPNANFMNKIQLEVASGHTFDAICMPVAFIHGYAKSGMLKDLTAYINDKKIVNPNLDLNDFIPSLLQIYGQYNGQLFAFPYKPDAQILFYRKDLFENEKIKEAYQAKNGKPLKVPDTIEELYDTARFFTRSFNSASPTKYGFNMQGQIGFSRFTFDNRLAAYGGKDVDKDLRPGFNNEAGINAMITYLELRKYCAPEWLQFGYVEANQFFIQGDVAMMEQWPGLSKTCEAKESKVKGSIGYAIVPGVKGVKAPTLGGWAMSLTKGAHAPELAYKFIEYVTSKDMELLKIASGNDPCRTSNYKRPEIIQANPLYQVLGESLARARIMADPDVPFISEKLDDIEENTINDVILGKMTPENAVRRMAERFEQELTAAGLEQ